MNFLKEVKKILVPIDQDDKQFSLKIIEDLNKIWENLGCKRM